jgi:hypothetical protein
VFFLCRIRIDWTCKFFCDVVWCIFDSIKIDFYRVKGYFSGESFVTLKKKKKKKRANLSKISTKRANLGLIRVNVKIKMIMIIVLKLN